MGLSFIAIKRRTYPNHQSSPLPGPAQSQAFPFSFPRTTSACAGHRLYHPIPAKAQTPSTAFCFALGTERTTGTAGVPAPRIGASSPPPWQPARSLSRGVLDGYVSMQASFLRHGTFDDAANQTRRLALAWATLARTVLHPPPDEQKPLVSFARHLEQKKPIDRIPRGAALTAAKWPAHKPFQQHHWFGPSAARGVPVLSIPRHHPLPTTARSWPHPYFLCCQHDHLNSRQRLHQSPGPAVQGRRSAPSSRLIPMSMCVCVCALVTLALQTGTTLCQPEQFSMADQQCDIKKAYNPSWLFFECATRPFFFCRRNSPCSSGRQKPLRRLSPVIH